MQLNVSEKGLVLKGTAFFRHIKVLLCSQQWLHSVLVTFKRSSSETNPLRRI